VLLVYFFATVIPVLSYSYKCVDLVALLSENTYIFKFFFLNEYIFYFVLSCMSLLIP